MLVAPVVKTPSPHVILHSADGPRAVDVEVVRTDADRSRGLMFRKTLAVDAGMLFLFEGDEPRTFWMHNTLLPLDMLFIDRDLKIVGIVESATPKTDSARGVKKPSRFVLEVNGGYCAAHAVKVGDRVEFVGL